MNAYNKNKSFNTSMIRSRSRIRMIDYWMYIALREIDMNLKKN